jgi:hypothetical protein
MQIFTPTVAFVVFEGTFVDVAIDPGSLPLPVLFVIYELSHV